MYNKHHHQMSDRKTRETKKKQETRSRLYIVFGCTLFVRPILCEATFEVFQYSLVIKTFPLQVNSMKIDLKEINETQRLLSCQKEREYIFENSVKECNCHKFAQKSQHQTSSLLLCFDINVLSAHDEATEKAQICQYKFFLRMWKSCVMTIAAIFKGLNFAYALHMTIFREKLLIHILIWKRFLQNIMGNFWHYKVW